MFGDYIRVKTGLLTGEMYGAVRCEDHDLFEGKILKVKKVVGEEPNLFYEIEGAEAMLFSKEMLEEPTMDEVEALHEVTIIKGDEPKAPKSVESQWPSAEVLSDPIVKMDTNVTSEYINTIREFVSKYRDAFKTEEMFWDFFFEKAETELILILNGISAGKKDLIINETIQGAKVQKKSQKKQK